MTTPTADQPQSPAVEASAVEAPAAPVSELVERVSALRDHKWVVPTVTADVEAVGQA